MSRILDSGALDSPLSDADDRCYASLADQISLGDPMLTVEEVAYETANALESGETIPRIPIGGSVAQFNVASRSWPVEVPFDPIGTDW